MRSPCPRSVISRRLRTSNRYFETIVIAVLQLLLVVVIVIAVADLWVVLGKTLLSGRLAELETVPDLQRALQRSLAGVLLILLGLEMMEALRTYFSEHRVVASISIVEPTDVHVLDESTQPSVTLVTCYPFYFVGNAPQRFIVRGVRDDHGPADVDANEGATPSPHL